MAHNRYALFSLLLCIMPTNLLSMRLREPKSILNEPIFIKPLYTTNQNFIYYVWNAQNTQTNRYEAIFPKKYIESVCINEDEPDDKRIELLFEPITPKEITEDESAAPNNKEYQVVLFFGKTEEDITAMAQVINNTMQQDGWNLNRILSNK